jgi:hypothetical protein
MASRRENSPRLSPSCSPDTRFRPHTPAHSVNGVGGILTEAGRVTGMVAGFVLLVQVLLMSRLRLLERLIGGHPGTRWRIGTYQEARWRAWGVRSARVG